MKPSKESIPMHDQWIKEAVDREIRESGLEIVEHGGRYAAAQWVESAGQWQAPMTDRARRLTGCHTVFARKLSGIFGSPCVATYATRRGARAALRKLFADAYR